MEVEGRRQVLWGFRFGGAGNSLAFTVSDNYLRPQSSILKGSMAPATQLAEALPA